MARIDSVEPVDSRLALRIYAALIGLGGVALAARAMAWGGAPAADPSPGRTAVLGMWSAMMLAAALVAAGLSSTDVLTRRRLLPWFIAGHAAVWLMLQAQFLVSVGDVHIARQASWIMLTVIVGLLYLLEPSPGARTRRRLLLSVAGRDATVTSGGFRVRHVDAESAVYEQQIREAAAQEERNRLARDLHDAVKQQIFAIQTSAATAEARMDTDPAGARAALTQVRQSAREAMGEMEALLSQLRVAALGNTGLVEAIRKHCEALAFRTGANVAVEVAPWPNEDALPAGAHQAIFRIVQEALANVGRHARARQVRVALDASTQRIEVRVQDDGTGFDTMQASAGMGLHNMRARAAEIGGTIEVGRAQGGGTLVTLSVPFQTQDEVQYLRRQALGFAAAYGLVIAFNLVNLSRNRLEQASIVLMFLLLLMGQLRTWWRLRGRSGPVATPVERRS
jgi:signal transduction histidine kinase